MTRCHYRRSSLLFSHSLVGSSHCSESKSHCHDLVAAVALSPLKQNRRQDSNAIVTVAYRYHRIPPMLRVAMDGGDAKAMNQGRRTKFDPNRTATVTVDLTCYGNPAINPIQQHAA